MRKYVKVQQVLVICNVFVQECKELKMMKLHDLFSANAFVSMLRSWKRLSNFA